jgi:hypothetical protein
MDKTEMMALADLIEASDGLFTMHGGKPRQLGIRQSAEVIAALRTSAAASSAGATPNATTIAAIQELEAGGGETWPPAKAYPWPKAFKVIRHAKDTWYGEIHFARFPTDEELQALSDFLNANHENALIPEPAKAGDEVMLREALADARNALVALRTRLKAEPSVQGRGWISLGIVLNNAVDKANAALGASLWECAARQQGTAGGNDPADCGWPVCGCDPYADKVIAALQESGALSTTAPQPDNGARGNVGAMREALEQALERMKMAVDWWNKGGHSLPQMSAAIEMAESALAANQPDGGVEGHADLASDGKCLVVETIDHRESSDGVSATSGRQAADRQQAIGAGIKPGPSDTAHAEPVAASGRYERLIKTLLYWRDNSTANSIELTRGDVIALLGGICDAQSYADLRASGGVAEQTKGTPIGYISKAGLERLREWFYDADAVGVIGEPKAPRDIPLYAHPPRSVDVEAIARAWHKARNEWLRASRHGTQEQADNAAIRSIAAMIEGLPSHPIAPAAPVSVDEVAKIICTAMLAELKNRWFCIPPYFSLEISARALLDAFKMERK